LILVDTSVWALHLQREVSALVTLLEADDVLVHPFVIGELALGNLPRRFQFLRDLEDLPRSATATDPEVLKLIDNQKLHGRGIGYVDAHLLASARLSEEALLWTLDDRLHLAAMQMKLAYYPSASGDKL
jgi:predicted nucleic acid-binding protein